MSITTASLTTTTGNIYVSTGQTVVTFLSLTNYSVGNVLANVYVVPSGDTASNNNVIISSIEIASLDTYQIYAGNEKLLLSNDDTIQAEASANASVTVVTSYSEI
jgi:hypothetical protein